VSDASAQRAQAGLSHLRLGVRHWELDLPVDASADKHVSLAQTLQSARHLPWTDQRRVETLDAVGRHDDLDVVPRVKAVELVEQLKQRPLDLALAAAAAVVPVMGAWR